ncbi:MAG: 16S rRNA methyltransferase [Opitutus sp.]|nr:16S rRNA methyltransferase [Opitutus sp.]
MNLLLFRPEETGRPLPARDPRARHLLAVLRRGAGGTFDAGLLNGPRGKGRIESISSDALTLSFRWESDVPSPDPITLIVGLARPQTARDILRDATTLGVAAIHFVATEKSEPSYAQSSLWREGEWERHLLAGAEQAFSTLVPQVTFDQSLETLLAQLPAAHTRIALDNYEAGRGLAGHPIPRDHPLALALGPERGWGACDRVALRGAGFTLTHLGRRVLRLETAAIAALTLTKAARGAL